MNRCVPSRPPTHTQPDIIMIIFIVIQFFLSYKICIHLQDSQFELGSSFSVCWMYACKYDEFYNLPNYCGNVHIKTCLQGVPVIRLGCALLSQVSQEPFVNGSLSSYLYEAARRSILLQFVISTVARSLFCSLVKHAF